MKREKSSPRRGPASNAIVNGDPGRTIRPRHTQTQANETAETHERGRDGLYLFAYAILLDKVLDIGLIKCLAHQ